jgi:chromosome partitioning protein
MAVVLSISNHKGGVGKTSVSVNLSHALALLGRKVLLVDCDPQANATYILGRVPPSEQTLGVADLLRNGQRSFADAIVESNVPGVSIVPATLDMFAMEHGLPDAARVMGLRAKLDERTRSAFDFIVCDTPPNIGPFQSNALAMAHYYVVPIQADSYHALVGMEILLNAADIIRAYCNPDLKFLRVVITMYDARTSISRAMADEIRRAFKGQVFETVINRNTVIAHSVLDGMTVFQKAAKAAGARDYLTLGKEVLEVLGV